MTTLESRPDERNIPQYEAQVRGFPLHRYNLALAHIRGPIPPSKFGYGILDVGGFKNNDVLNGLLYQLFPGTKAVSLNVKNELHGRSGDITYLDSIPLPDNSIPVPIAVDVFEHIPREGDKRKKIFDEMLRVSSHQVIISGPFFSESNRELEREVLRQMAANGLAPKASLIQHLDPRYGPPTISELVAMARQTGKPFKLYPGTIAASDFQGLISQVKAIAENPSDGVRIAKEIAKAIESQLKYDPQPTWQQAYRAVLVVDKSESAEILPEDEIFHYTERVIYQAALSQAGYGFIEDPIKFYHEVPSRGRHVVFEGPEGVGKSSLMRSVSEILRRFGRNVAIITNSGLRQDIRDMESGSGRLIAEPARGQYFAHAMAEAIISGNAQTLVGDIALSDRSWISVPMHWQLYCKDDITIPNILQKRIPTIPPDLTIILETPDLNQNWENMRRNQDMANIARTREQLEYQRDYYRNITTNEKNGQIIHVVNPGTDGSRNQVLKEVLSHVERCCGLPDNSLVALLDER